jgi:hypothetical protein
MITLQRSNPTVTQILAAHGCQTTALQDRYDIHTYGRQVQPRLLNLSSGNRKILRKSVCSPSGLDSSRSY